MADTPLRVADVIVPEVYTDYIVEESIKKTTFYRSGLLYLSAELNSLLAGGGTTFNIPFWQQLTGAPQAIQSNTTLEVKKTSTAKMVARRLMYGKGWSAEELAAALSGTNPMATISSMVDTYWDWNMQGYLINIIKGVMADNADNDSSDLINDITTSGTVGTANRISSPAVIDTVKLLGDNAQDFAVIAMHSTVYYRAVDNDLIDYIKSSESSLDIPMFMGLRVVVTDLMPADVDGSNTVYWTVIFKPNSIAYGESARGITVVETAREASKSEDQLFTRRQFSMAPQGFKWIETSVAAEMPTASELEEAGNWDRVFELKNCGFVILKTNG